MALDIAKIVVATSEAVALLRKLNNF